MGFGVMTSINQEIDFDIAALVEIRVQAFLILGTVQCIGNNDNT